MEITQEMIKRAKDGECPYCGSMDISYDNVKIDGNEAVQECHCMNCDRLWNEIYILDCCVLDDMETIIKIKDEEVK